LNELINNITNAGAEDEVLGNNSLSLATTRNTTETPLTTGSSDSSGRRVAEEARDMDQGTAKRTEDLVIEASKFDKASSMTMTFVAATRRNASEDGATDTSSDKPAFVTIDASDESGATMTINSFEVANALQLQIPENLFKRYEKIGFFLPGICADFVPSAVDEFNASAFEGIEIEGPIGVNVTALEAAGVNLTELAEKLRNDVEVDEILTRTNLST
uniref:SERPIN domain-containing protein n=1 Tax=Anisakis simplex TaxID=6269 RepID=A0A0M3KFU4_ANISI